MRSGSVREERGLNTGFSHFLSHMFKIYLLQRIMQLVIPFHIPAQPQLCFPSLFTERLVIVFSIVYTSLHSSKYPRF